MRRFVGMLAAAALLFGWMAPAALAGSGLGKTLSATFHLHSLTLWGLPVQANKTNCPSWVLNDYALTVATGNGVFHITVAKTGAWGTFTFTGSATVTFYPPLSLTNIVYNLLHLIVLALVIGPSDKILTGRLTQWFGFSANEQSTVFSGTVNFGGTDLLANPVGAHGTFHGVWNHGALPLLAPPVHFIANFLCR
jgi:hypothetical protein